MGDMRQQLLILKLYEGLISDGWSNNTSGQLKGIFNGPNSWTSFDGNRTILQLHIVP